MAEANTEDDPSIEDILDSIREIISDDDEGDSNDSATTDDAADAPEPEPESEPKPDPITKAEPEPQTEDEILDLTDRVDGDLGEEGDDQDDVEIEIDMIDPEEDHFDDAVDKDDTDEDDADTGFDDPAPINAPPRARETFEGQNMADDDDSLFTDGAREAAMEAFENLARTAMVERAGQITIEDVVRHEIRPLLKSWLDENLSGIVERLVEKEMQRISSRYLDN